MSGITIQLAPSTPPATTAAPSTHTPRVTAYDMEERLTDFLGSDGGENALRQCRRAVSDALRELQSAHRWSYLQGPTRVFMSGYCTLGTVAYQYSSGAYPRQLTLTPDPVLGGAWPSWAASGYVRLNNIVAKVASYVSPTVITLQDPLDFSADFDQAVLGAGLSYSLFRDSYTLPADYLGGENALAETIWGTMEYVPPAQWLAWIRYRESYGTPQWYTVMGDPNVPGRMCVKVYPYPDTDATLDMLYQRKPRAVQTFDNSSGHASVNAQANAQLVTFDGNYLGQQHVGSVLRLAADAAGPPTGTDGLRPYLFEGNVLTVPAANQCTVEAAVPQTLTGVGFRVSDPIDFEDNAMLVAYSRCCEKHLAIARSMKTADRAAAAYREALMIAKESDAKIISRRAAGLGAPQRARMAFMPAGPDIS